MKVSIAILAAVLMSAVVQSSVVAGQTAKPGKPSGKHADSKKIDIASLVTGKAVVVIYHPGSKPAMRALPQILSVVGKSKTVVTVYALCVRTDEATWKASVKALPANIVPLWDPAGRSERAMNARKALGTDAYPTIIVTDPDGKVRDAFAGWFSGDRRLAPLLSE